MLIFCIAFHLMLLYLINAPVPSSNYTFRGALKYYTPSKRFYKYTFCYVSFLLFLISSLFPRFYSLLFYTISVSAFFFFYQVKINQEKTLFSKIKPKLRKYFKAIKDPRSFSDSFTTLIIITFSVATIFLTFIIAFFIFKEFFAFLKFVNFWDFITGTYWWPNEFEVIGGKAFGVLPLFVGTILTSLIAVVFATPLSVMVAIYTSEYAHSKLRGKIKFMLEMLANIPTVVYGFFAAFILSKWLYTFSMNVGYTSFSAESALVSGLVIGVMITPYMITLIDDALRAVPDEIRNTAISLGAIRSEVVTKVLLSIITPSIVSVIIIALSRAIGETMIVVMAAGLMANMTLSPLESITTATVQIVTLLTGDTEFNNPKTLAAFAIASVLFCMTLTLNTISIWISKKFEVKL